MHLSSSMNLAEKYRRSGHFEKKWRPIIPQFPAWINSLQLQPPCNHSPRPVPAKCVPIIGLLEGTCHGSTSFGIIASGGSRCGIARCLDGCSRVNAWKTEIHNECRGPGTMDNSRRSYASNEPKFPLLRFLFFFYFIFSSFLNTDGKVTRRGEEEEEEIRISFLNENFVNCKKVCRRFNYDSCN